MRHGKVKNQQDFLKTKKNLKWKEKMEPVCGFKPRKSYYGPLFMFHCSCSLLMQNGM